LNDDLNNNSKLYSPVTECLSEQGQAAKPLHLRTFCFALQLRIVKYNTTSAWMKHWLLHLCPELHSGRSGTVFDDAKLKMRGGVTVYK
jgi:hypothetical protein